MAEIEIEEKSFAELFEKSQELQSSKFRSGDRVSGNVIKITKDTIFVNLGGKSEGFSDTIEFMDKEGNLIVKEGDLVEMRVASTRDGIHLTKGMKVQGADAMELLLDAKENFLPVEGRVSAVNKGGFEVDLTGNRAFCPLGQIDLQFCEKPEVHVGARYLFRILEIKERGKNIVVSRRALLEEDREKNLKETLAKLTPGLECEGTVTKLLNFGAFVDIGGIEGMVHVSEISHLRINQPADVLATGQPVKVKVLKIETDKKGNPKIALSIKALEPDSWEKGFEFSEGEIIRGKVSRLTDFGAFVEVAPGVDGLVHISEISYERISHPSKVLHEGEEIEVMVMGVDREKHRVSLSLKEAMAKKRMREEGWEEVRLEIGQILKGTVDDIKPFGLFVRLPQLGTKVRGLLPMEELREADKADAKKKFPKGKEIDVEIVAIDEKERIRLSQKVIKEREDRADYNQFLEDGDKSGKLGTLGDIFKGLKLK
jgi:small subunit ribosomal protein S1